MKKTISTLILSLALAAALAAEIEFTGVFYLGDKGHFSLVESDTGTKSRWLQIGNTFQGYRVESYDRDKGVLEIAASAQRLFLSLRPSVIQEAKVTIQGKLQVAAEREIEIKNAVLVLGEESRFPIDDKTWVRVRVVKADGGNFRYEIHFEEKDEDDQVVLLSAPTVIAAPNQSFSVQAGNNSFSYEP